MAFRFYLETYGCSLNAADSGVIIGRMEGLGGERVKSLSDADIIIVNTCGVKEPTEDKIIHRLGEISSIDIPVIVAGCLPRISYHRIENTIPGFAAMIGPQSIEVLGSIVPQIIEGERGITLLDATDESKLEWFRGPPDSVICTIPICEGCLGSCAYCAVRLARGDVKSHLIGNIVDVVTRCVHLGYKEIRLTSQDAGVFGHDTGESLAHLLSEVASIEGSHRFRLGMFNPNLVLNTMETILTSMESDHFFRFFHVPLQSGSDAVLHKMGRLYTTSEWKAIVGRIRNRFPEAAIATDIIVGFPGETDEDFAQTMSLIEEVKPAVVNISKYGDRPGTRASKSKKKVETSLKKNRSRELTRLVSEIALELHRSRIGGKEQVLVVEPGTKGGWMCRNQSYQPVIVRGELEAGTLLDVQITSAARTHLIGRPIS